MPEFLSAGVFIEEVAAGPRVIQGVSTSSMGMVSKAAMGPVDEATLLTGFGSYSSIFGSFLADSYGPLNMAGFFANGGSRAYMVRVAASDAVIASGGIRDVVASDLMGTGNGTLKSFTHTLEHTTPIRKHSVRVVAGSVVGTDDGSGLITGAGIDTGSVIDYDTGVTTVVFVTAPATGVPVIASYDKELIPFKASSPGVWGNNLRLVLSNNEDYPDFANGKFTRQDLVVQMKDSTGVYQDAETYAGLSFLDPTSLVYWKAVVDAGSDLLVSQPGNLDRVPVVLNGTAATQSLGTGTGAPQTITETLTTLPVMKKTFKITDGTAVITDDGQGNLIGDVDPSGVNTIDYTTGDVNVKATFEDSATITATWFQSGLDSVSFDFSGGSDGAAAISRNEVSAPTLAAARRGIYAFDRVDDILQLAIPDFAGDVTVSGDQVTFAESRKNRFAVLATPSGLNPQEAVDFVKYKLVPNTSYAAMYYPWVTVTDPLTNLPKNVPPIGHVAGVYARTDTNKNVGKSPGGIDDGALNFCIGLERKLDKGERDILYPQRINPLIDSPITGRAVWGVRTLALDPLYRYINARRLLMFLEASTYNSTQWVVFENNNTDTRDKVQLQLSSFLLGLFGQGYFAGDTPADSFFVQCDDKNNPQEIVNQGMLVCAVGVAPNKPAEFVRFQFQQRTITSG